LPRSILDARHFNDQALASLATDEQHFRLVLDVVAGQLAALQQRLAELRRQEVPQGAARFQRDLEIHSVSQQHHRLSRLGTEICLGRFDRRDGSRVYVGRMGLRDGEGRPLLADWRTPAAAPFFAATLREAMGVVRRRRFRWSGGLVVDSWDEWLDLDVEQEQTGLQDSQSAFLAALAANRSGRMSSVLATIQADQDAIIRAPASGCTVVDGGPGTGKTVVALHRAAYLAFHGSDPVLYVTKHPRLASYVRDVLPSLGEEDVPVAGMAELYADAATRPAAAPEAVRLKGDVRMAEAIDRAVRFFQDLPDTEVIAELPDRDVEVRPEHWREALATCTETQHVPRRSELLEALGERLAEPRVSTDRQVRQALWAGWPDLSAAQVVGDLLRHRGLLRHCAPWLSAQEQETILADARADDGWHEADLPLLDYAHQRLGLPARSAEPVAELRLRRAAAKAAVADLMAAAGEGSALHLLRDTTFDGLAPVDELLEPPDALPPPTLPDRVFAHVVVDEAQDLTGMEWLALLWRCPSRSITAVGDRAQSPEPFDESWTDRLAGVGLPGAARVLRLSVNYRTPEVLMRPAVAVIRAARPSVEVPEAIRTDGTPLVVERVVGEVDLVDVALDRAAGLVAQGGTAGVVAHASRHRPEAPEGVTFFTPADLQGLEMDAVVVVEPAELWGDGEAAAAGLYVTLTRATQAVCLLHRRDLPPCARPVLEQVSPRQPARSAR
jgi:hypothetical protein